MSVRAVILEYLIRYHEWRWLKAHTWQKAGYHRRAMNDLYWRKKGRDDA